MIAVRKPPMRTDRVGMLREDGRSYRWTCSRCGIRKQVRPHNMNPGYICQDCKDVLALCVTMSENQ